VASLPPEQTRRATIKIISGPAYTAVEMALRPGQRDMMLMVTSSTALLPPEDRIND
jgi:hypothetical protein